MRCRPFIEQNRSDPSLGSFREYGSDPFQRSFFVQSGAFKTEVTVPEFNGSWKNTFGTSLRTGPYYLKLKLSLTSG
jgi:hypothetical protein